MAQFDEKTRAIIRRLQNARLSLMANQPFYAFLLMNMKFALDVTCETAYTDGVRIAFSPDFMDELSDDELEFVLMHEVLHVALAHPFRYQDDYQEPAFGIACDIIVNSNILYTFGMDKRKITLKKYGESMHLMPNGDEGYKYSIEEAYAILLDEMPKQDSAKGKKKDKRSNGDGKGDGQGHASSGSSSADCGGAGDDQDRGQSGIQDRTRNQDGGRPGLEELIASIRERNSAIAESLKREGKADEPQDGSLSEGERFDDHTFWVGDDDMGSLRDTWMNRLIEATDFVASMKGVGHGCGTVPLAVERMVAELKNPKLDWRTILNDFVQEEICDYSFSPPDKRMEDSPFYLPDFNEKDEAARNLLFMIDTSGSMSDEAITECYSEIYGAIQQFNGKLTGKLGFFDAVVVEPVPFEDEEEFKIIRPKGGGGTSFHIIFDYVRDKMQEDPPVSIIILTDGYAPFPDEAAAMDIPVLWIINNKEAAPPPWGKIAILS